MNKNILEQIINNSKIEILIDYDEIENVYYKKGIIYTYVLINDERINMTEEIITEKKVKITKEVLYKKAYNRLKDILIKKITDI